MNKIQKLIGTMASAVVTLLTGKAAYAGVVSQTPGMAQLSCDSVTKYGTSKPTDTVLGMEQSGASNPTCYGGTLTYYYCNVTINSVSQKMAYFAGCEGCTTGSTTTNDSYGWADGAPNCSKMYPIGLTTACTSNSSSNWITLVITGMSRTVCNGPLSCAAGYTGTSGTCKQCEPGTYKSTTDSAACTSCTTTCGATYGGTSASGATAYTQCYVTTGGTSTEGTWGWSGGSCFCS